MNAIPTFFGEPGEPAPAVDSDDLKTVYDIFLDTPREHAGAGAVSVEFFQSVCKPGADIPSVIYRAMMLGMILDIAKEQVAPWIRDGQVDSAVFREVAQLPMAWMGSEPQGLPLDLEELVRGLRGGRRLTENRNELSCDPTHSQKDANEWPTREHTSMCSLSLTPRAHHEHDR